jgi:3'-5' exoribonuclease
VILDLQTVKAGMQLKDVDVFLQSFSKKVYGNEGKYCGDGVLYCEGYTLNLKIWEMQLVDALIQENVVGKALTVTGSISEYRGKLQFVVTYAKANNTLSRADFLNQEGMEESKQEFFKFINTHISQDYIKVLMAIFNTDNTMEAFCKEFAGSKMHDAKVGGLVNHTNKMLKLASVLVESDKRLEPYKDLLYTGIVIHDVGKVKELDLGVYTQNAFVTHRLFGCELLASCRGTIIENIGETNYYHLQAIIQGHHGQWGESPKTVWAYIVHLIDMVDACTTGVLDKIDRNEFTEENGMRKVYLNDSYVTI